MRLTTGTATLFVLLLLPALCFANEKPAVISGLDVLESRGFQPLQGLRVGVITNHTGVNRAGVSIIELLRKAPGVSLRAVFAPEHGLKGIIEGEYGSSFLDGDSLPVFSLYGETRKPRAEWLKGLDVLVFDIQDIGTRFYTYISTMALAMQAAAAAGIEFMVLDRPNPVGGVLVEGPLLEESLRGDFIAYYPIPVRHGMTVGELAGLFNEEFGIGVGLTVIPTQGWRRGMFYDQTGLGWIDPSPNMRSLRAALLYPGLGIAEATNLSVGRGTDIPFELYGAPWVDGPRLARALNGAGLKGIEFKDTTFTPVSHVFQGRTCHGVRATVTDRQTFLSLDAGLHLLAGLKRHHPERFDLSKIDRWIGRKDVKTLLAEGVPVEEIVRGWQPDLRKFMAVRERHLIYEP